MDDSEVDGTGAQTLRRPARERIFETARRTFYERGIRAVGVETIASEAEATKMTLYRNFPSKDELIAEVMREQARDYWRWWDEVLSCTCDPRQQLEALFDASEVKAAESDVHGCPLANAAIELHETDHPAQKVSMEHKRELHRRLTELARRAGAPNDDLADGLMLLMEGSCSARVTLGGDGPVRALARTGRGLIALHLGPARD
ncbi:TetR/AcrR family transcriptional regulator [Caulobacter sp. CCUG 60055]